MISVIVPVYNMEKYLDKCIGSILNQDYKDIELILVDDGSKDASPAICDEYAAKDNRVKVIHKQNGGQGSARNMALDIAKGEYIGFIDSDDWIEPDMYSNLLNNLLKQNAQISTCGIKDVYENGKIIEHNFTDHEKAITSYEALESRVNGKALVTDSPCNKLYKRELFDNIRYPENRLLEDSAVMYRILDKVTVVALSEKIGYNVRCDMSSVSRRKYNKRRCDTIITYTEMADFFASEKKYCDLVPYANAFVAGAVFYNAGEMFGVDFENKNETEKHVQKCAKELLASKRKLSMKNKVLLGLISVSPKAFGLIYKLTKKG